MLVLHGLVASLIVGDVLKGWDWVSIINLVVNRLFEAEVDLDIKWQRRIFLVDGAGVRLPKLTKNHIAHIDNKREITST